MPLVRGPRAATKKGMAANYKAESKTKPKKQSIAIMLALAGKSKKKK